MSQEESHIISKDRILLDALEAINGIEYGPLVLFVLDEEKRMIGTLTDGDIRRGLLRGLDVHDKISAAAHRNFNYLIHS